MEDYKFITPVSMRCTKEQFENDLKEPLEKMGHDEINAISLNFNRILLNSHEANPSLNFCSLVIYNPELFMALAAMTDKPEGISGEWWMCKMGSLTYKKGYIYQAITPNAVELGVFIKATKEEIIDYFSKPLSTLMNEKPEKPMENDRMIVKECPECKGEGRILVNNPNGEWVKAFDKIGFDPKDIQALTDKGCKTSGESEQLYKLKEEVKKYWHGNLKDGHKYTLSDWEAVGWNKEALEPIPERVTVQLFDPGNSGMGCTRLFKFEDGNNGEWTEKERKDIEHLLNGEYGELVGLRYLVSKYSNYHTNQMIKKEDSVLFVNWMKENE